MTSPEAPVTRPTRSRATFWAILALVAAFVVVRQVVLPALGCPT